MNTLETLFSGIWHCWLMSAYLTSEVTKGFHVDSFV